jgi:hypothetical protein
VRVGVWRILGGFNMKFKCQCGGILGGFNMKIIIIIYMRVGLGGFNM